MVASVRTLLIAFLLNGLLASGAYRKQSVDASGAIAGFMLGTIIFLAGTFGFWIILVTFFLSSSLLSRLGAVRKEQSGKMHQRGHRRDWVQVTANGGVGTLFALLYLLTGAQICATAFAAAFAAANADTWASEIGVLSRRPPVSVLDGRPLSPGTSGGVSPLGYGAAAAGSLLIAAVYFSMQLLQTRPLFALVAETTMIFASGFLGAWIDSLIGATIQAKYLCSVEGTETERSRSNGQRNNLVRGFRFMTNDAVNFLSGFLSTSAAAFLLSLIYH
jgi:uncharacterized protein (TIGR00297 family)